MREARLSVVLVRPLAGFVIESETEPGPGSERQRLAAAGLGLVVRRVWVAEVPAAEELLGFHVLLQLPGWESYLNEVRDENHHELLEGLGAH